MCHYTSLNQEVTLLANDVPVGANGDHEFRLDLSDETSNSSSDDEVILQLEILDLWTAVKLLFYVILGTSSVMF